MKFTFSLKFSLFLISSLFLFSCAKTNSDNIKTSGIRATFSVVGNNQNSVTCTASFQVGEGVGGTYLDLDANDSITCNGNSMSKTDFVTVSYSATVPYQVGGTYTLVFTRAGEGSYTSTVTLPEAISNYSPNTAQTLQKGSPLNISWTPSSNATDDSFSAYLSLSGVSELLTDSPPEQGALGFGSAETTPSPSNTGNITGTLEYSRSRTGTMATGLSGSITASQKASISVTLTD